MPIKLRNFIQSVLVADLDLTSTTIYVASVVSMPTLSTGDFFYLTIVPAGAYASIDTAEIVKVTAISGNALTVIRAQDGTTAKKYVYGDTVYSAITAGTLSETLSNTGVVAGTYAKVTVDIQGRVNKGESLTESDIPVLDASKTTTGTFAVDRLPKATATTLGVVKPGTGLDVSPDGSLSVSNTTLYSSDKGISYIALAGSDTLVSTDAIKWRQYTGLCAITNNGYIFVAVGFNGCILISTDTGITWELQESTTNKNLRGVTFGNGLFVAVGDNGTILTSMNGNVWIAQKNTSTADLHYVTFVNKLFIAVGNNGAILTSTDATTWAVQTLTVPTTYTFKSVTFGAGIYVAVGINGIVYTSTNATSWTKASTGATNALYSIAFYNNIFVAVGVNRRSTCTYIGGTFSISDALDVLSTYCISADNNGFFAVGNSDIYYSSDGVKWYSRPYGVNNLPPAMSNIGATYVIVSAKYIHRSIDNTNTWTSVSDGYNLSANSGVFALDKYILVGDSNKILYSADGLCWSSVEYPAPYVINAVRLHILYSILYANKILVAVGMSQTPKANGYELHEGCIITSRDGITWSRLIPVPKTLRSVAFGVGIYVAVGDSGTIVTSYDGGTWTSRSSNTTANINMVGWLNNRFVAVGDNGLCIVSNDGTTWFTYNAIGSTTLKCITYGNGTFVAVGVSGTICTSNDLKTWSINTVGSVAFTTAIYTNNTFYIGSYQGIYTSKNAQSWVNTTEGYINLGGSLVNAIISTIKNINPTLLPSASKTSFGCITVGSGLDITDGIISTSAMSQMTISPISGTIQNLGAPAKKSSVDSTEFIGVGTLGTIAYSTDGISSWNIPASYVETDTQTINAIAYNSLRCVVVGSSGIIRYCDLGYKMWYIAESNTKETLTSVVWGSDKFIAVGSNNTILKSSDGKTWTPIPYNPTNRTTIMSITYSNNYFIATGTNDCIIYANVSQIDTWNTVPGPFSGMWYNATVASTSTAVFVGSGAVVYATLGSSTAPLTSGSSTVYVASGSGSGSGSSTVYVISGLSTAYKGTITARTSFSKINSNTSYDKAFFVNDMFFAVTSNIIIYSTDGKAWYEAAIEGINNSSTSTINVAFINIAYNNGFYYAGASNALYVSANGKTWIKNTKAPKGDTNSISEARGFILSPIFTILGYNSYYAYNTTDSSWTRYPYGSGFFNALYGCYSTTTNKYLYAFDNYGRVFCDSITSSTAPNLYSITAGDQHIVAVGEFGVIRTVQKGSFVWSVSAPVSYNTLRDVTYAAGMYVAVGDKGTVVTSTDSSTWILQTSGVTDNLVAVKFFKGLFIAVGGSYILVSIDGIHWVQVYYVGSSATAVMACSKDIVVVSSGVYIYTSIDGVHWSFITLDTNNVFNNIIYANNMFIASVSNSTRMWISYNGTTWKTSSAPTDATYIKSAIAYANKQLYFFGFRTNSTTIYTSVDSVSWVKQKTLPVELSMVCTIPLDSAVVGKKGIVVSKQLSSWYNTYYGTRTQLSAAAYRLGIYIAVGFEGSILSYNKIYSTAGSSTRVLYNYNGPTTASNLNAVTVGNSYNINKIIAVGKNGALVISHNGNGFTSTSIGVSAHLNDIIHHNFGTWSEYIVVGDSGTVQSSLSGVYWVSRLSGVSNNINAICSLPDTTTNAFVVVGSASFIRVCNSAYSWSAVTVAGAGAVDLYAVTTGLNMCVAVGQSGTIIYSTVATYTVWNLCTKITTSDLYAVKFITDRFFAVGADSTILSSVNGINWTEHFPNCITQWNGIANIDGVAHVYGNNGDIAVFNGVSFDIPKQIKYLNN